MSNVKDKTTNGAMVTDPESVLDRLDGLLISKSGDAWQIFNVLAFMAEALPDDEMGDLPMRCTVANLRDQMETLAQSLMDLSREARHE
jgi:hypothetical protein